MFIQNIKDDRTIYHKSEKAKIKTIFNKIDIEDTYNYGEKIITNQIDYALKWSDNYSWTSDGGSVLMETDKSLNQKFENIIQQTSFWNDYKKYKKEKYVKMCLKNIKKNNF